MSTKTAALTPPPPAENAEMTPLKKAEEATGNLSDDELRLFGAWLARYASRRLDRPVTFSFRPLTDEEEAYGRKLARELNV